MRHHRVVLLPLAAAFRPFFSLELVEGGSLAQRLAGKPLPVRQAADLVETLARAMACAHRHNVIHRDLKPANILLTAEGAPKITDFGLAKRLDTLGQTVSGAVMGTPSYMAPEQARGDSKEVGAPTDIYALGAILYECLTGRPPFVAESTMATLEQVRDEDPVPPRQLNVKVPRDLETIKIPGSPPPSISSSWSTPGRWTSVSGASWRWPKRHQRSRIELFGIETGLFCRP